MQQGLCPCWKRMRRVKALCRLSRGRRHNSLWDQKTNSLDWQTISKYQLLMITFQAKQGKGIELPHIERWSSKRSSTHCLHGIHARISTYWPRRWMRQSVRSPSNQQLHRPKVQWAVQSSRRKTQISFWQPRRKGSRFSGSSFTACSVMICLNRKISLANEQQQQQHCNIK